MHLSREDFARSAWAPVMATRVPRVGGKLTSLQSYRSGRQRRDVRINSLFNRSICNMEKVSFLH